mgnify:CR=1 FL=1
MTVTTPHYRRRRSNIGQAGCAVSDVLKLRVQPSTDQGDTSIRDSASYVARRAILNWAGQIPLFDRGLSGVDAEGAQ